MGISQISIGFNERQKKQLEKERDRLGSPIASIVRMAVVEYFQRQEESS
jgi:hypothetical protein